MKHQEKLVINWHLLEACNYNCKFCFAKYDGDKGAVYQNADKTTQLLEALWNYFKPQQFNNRLRLNIAGGEPTLLQGKLLKILQVAKQIGFKTSIITNASYLHNIEFATHLYKNLDILGISIDAIDTQHNRKIGRVGTGLNAQPLEAVDIIAYVAMARKINPAIKIKINTVVNAVNKDDDLSAFIANIQPDKWKLFQVLPQSNDKLIVSDDKFHQFVQRHQAFNSIIIAEDNDAMRESYIMIEPKGRFYQNRQDNQKGHHYSQPILDIGVAEAFKQIRFEYEKFASRYQPLVAFKD
ncbi:MAG: viperin family antiviral radical SAM protein [Alphaproteobacteria bacterium]|nr:viperin family antiviral radical SAM protein [Alphaproteobacteria bacterium]